MVTGKPGWLCADRRSIARVMPSRKNVSASSLLPWRYGVATSSSVFGTASVANRSGKIDLKDRRSQT